MTKEIFDFGFTAVTEDELEVVSELQSKADTAYEIHNQLHEMYNAILPLLSNLKANPEKDYIYWPNRSEKIEAFEEILYKIYKR